MREDLKWEGKEICVVGGGGGDRGRWVGGGVRVMTWRRRRRDIRGTYGDGMGRERGHVRGGYWFPGAKTCSCAPHFAYRATVGSKMKCKMNERCYKKMEMHYRGRRRGGGGPCDENLSKSYYN